MLPSWRRSSAPLVLALTATTLLVPFRGTARAQSAPAPAAAPGAVSATPAELPAPDPSAVRECGVRVRKAGIGITGLGFIIGATGAALLFDGANHPQSPPRCDAENMPAGCFPGNPPFPRSRAERNAGWALIGIGIAVTAPGIYLWVKGQQTINEVDRAAKPAPRVSTFTPLALRGGGGLGYIHTF